MEAAGLTDLLKQEGDFTLFAPTDEAFAGLSQRDIDMLTSASKLCNLWFHYMSSLNYNHITVGQPEVQYVFFS